MEEAFDNAIHELKRVDHLFYVSLKYTRTVDMIKHVIERMISSLNFGIEALLKYAESKRLIASIPANNVLRAELVKKTFPENSELAGYVAFLTLLMKLRRAEYDKREEFRRHVTMIASIDNGEIVEVTIDVLGEYYEKVKDYLEMVKKTIYGEQ